MTLPDRPDEDDLPPRERENGPGAAVWMIAGCAVVLIYVAVLGLLRPVA
jgi:hypothetical protein